MNMSYMLYGCKDLISVDLSNFDTSYVQDMSYMLYDCNKLTSIDLSSFNTRQVAQMEGMFCNCHSLETLDLAGFETVGLINMRSMSAGCSNLKELDIRNFNLVRLRENSFFYIFYKCDELCVIHTPFNLRLNQDLEDLPKKEESDQWYKSGMGDDAAVDKLPKNLDHSILLIKNKRFEYPCITAQQNIPAERH